MTSISKTTLGKLIKFQRGYDLPKSEIVDGIYPVRSSNGILGYHNEYKTKGPGITIGRSGTVGIPHLIKTNFYPHNTSLFIKDFKGNDVHYIFYLLTNLKLRDKKSGSGVPTMNRNHLHPLEILAHLDVLTQKQIAKVLSGLDSKIELNNKINQELEAMAKLIYDYWFVQFDFPDENGKPYKSSGGKMVYNEELKREIPKNWEDGVLSDVADITMGQSPSGSSYNEERIGTVFYQGSTDFGSRFPIVRKYTTQPSRMAEEGDILLSVRAPVGTMNQAMKYCCIGRGLAALREKEGSISFLWSQMEYFKQIFDRRNTSGTTFGSITKDDLFDLKLCIPKKEVIENFKKLADPFHNQIINNSLQSEKLSGLRDWLLPMLMNGQVTVGAIHAEEEEKLGTVAENKSTYNEVKVISFKELYPDPYIRKQREAKKHKLKRRQVLTTTRIIHLHQENKQELGHTKTEKINHAIEYIAELDLGRDPVKNVGGPVDFYYVKAFVEPLAKKQKVFEAIETPDGYYYETKENFQTFYNVSYKDKDLTPYNSKIDGIISSFVELSLRETELYMTVYAGWNNLLIRKEETTLKDIVKESIDLWKDKRDKFIDDDVENAIEWLTNKNYDPKGFGKEVF